MSNSLQIWPSSPLPVDISREPIWNEHQIHYDSGAYQGQTAYQKPLYRYEIPWSIIPVTKQSSLEAFLHRHRKITPFFFKDPYDSLSKINSAVCVNTSFAVNTFRIRTIDSFTVFPDSAFLTITSALSGALNMGSHYLLDHDTGILTVVLTPAATDYWTVQSCQYFRKCVFKSYSDRSPRWELFQVDITIQEIAK